MRERRQGRGLDDAGRGQGVALLEQRRDVGEAPVFRLRRRERQLQKAAPAVLANVPPTAAAEAVDLVELEGIGRLVLNRRTHARSRSPVHAMASSATPGLIGS